MYVCVCLPVCMYVRPAPSLRPDAACEPRPTLEYQEFPMNDGCVRLGINGKERSVFGVEAHEYTLRSLSLFL